MHSENIPSLFLGMCSLCAQKSYNNVKYVLVMRSEKLYSVKYVLVMHKKFLVRLISCIPHVFGMHKKLLMQELRGSVKS